MTPIWGQRRGKPQKKLLEYKDVKSIGFAAVSYGGSGKYCNTDVCLQWDYLQAAEDDLPVAFAEAAYQAGTELDYKKPPSFDRLIHPNDPSKMHEGSEYGKQVVAGRGWWPVCIVHWHGEAADHGWNNEAAYLEAAHDGRLCAYAVCWYQLTDGSWVLVLWRVMIRARL